MVELDSKHAQTFYLFDKYVFLNENVPAKIKKVLGPQISPGMKAIISEMKSERNILQDTVNSSQQELKDATNTTTNLQKIYNQLEQMSKRDLAEAQNEIKRLESEKTTGGISNVEAKEREEMLRKKIQELDLRSASYAADQRRGINLAKGEEKRIRERLEEIRRLTNKIKDLRK